MRVDIQRNWLCLQQKVTCSTHTHPLFYEYCVAEYIPFLNYYSYVKAITFVDNHVILVLSFFFFFFFFLLLAIVSILVKFVMVNLLLLMMNLFFYVGYIRCI